MVFQRTPETNDNDNHRDDNDDDDDDSVDDNNVDDDNDFGTSIDSDKFNNSDNVRDNCRWYTEVNQAREDFEFECPWNMVVSGNAGFDVS